MADATALDPATTAELLNGALVTLRAEIAAMPATVRTWHPAAGEWCAHEVIGHLIETERRGFAGRIRIILGSESPALSTWDQVQVAKDRRDCARDVAGLLDEFARLRQDGIALVRGLKDDQLERGGQHATVGWLRVSDLLHEWVHHDRNHLKQIMANVQAFAWPHMGNARRFSEG